MGFLIHKIKNILFVLITNLCPLLWVNNNSGSVWWCKLLSRRWMFRYRSWPWHERKCSTTLSPKEGPNSFQWSTIDWAGETFWKSKVHASTIRIRSDSTLLVHQFSRFYHLKNNQNFALKVFVNSRTCRAGSRSWTKRNTSENMVSKSTNEAQETVAKAWCQYG